MTFEFQKQGTKVIATVSYKGIHFQASGETQDEAIAQAYQQFLDNNQTK